MNNFVTMDKYNELLRKFEDLERALRYIKGDPIIQGYKGKRFDLNDNLNVVNINKEISGLKARIAALEIP
jgi:hypothetical protein